LEKLFWHAYIPEETSGIVNARFRKTIFWNAVASEARHRFGFWDP
jgi:hypothetical protein